MTTAIRLEQLRIEVAGQALVAIEQLQLPRAAMLGLVGESGSGKSLTAKALLGLLDSRYRVQCARAELFGLEHALIQGRTPVSMAAVFQHPAGAFTPVLRIGQQIDEVCRCRQGMSRRAARERSLALLAQMQLHDPLRVYHSYPHQLSGGMLQRAAIALALACEPQILIADEPTTALDAASQTEVLRLLKQLQRDYQLSVLLISHDLPLVARYSEQVAVMWRGAIVEYGAAADVLQQPSHPYTQRLLAARPRLRADYHRQSRLTVGEHPL